MNANYLTSMDSLAALTNLSTLHIEENEIPTSSILPAETWPSMQDYVNDLNN